jgi:hypothetical protein
VSIVTTEWTDSHLCVNATQAGAGVAGVLNAAKVIFSVAPFAPSKTLLPGAITQSPDAGLAPATVTWSPAVRDGANDIVTISDLIAIQLALSANACVIYGYALTDVGGTHVLLSEMLAQPLNLPDNVTAFGLLIPFAPAVPQTKKAQVTF